MMPFAAYGQGPVLVTPFKMARVAATVAAGGAMPQGRWVTGREQHADRMRRAPFVPAETAAFLAAAMRSVVTGGTARRAMSGAELDAWQARPARRRWTKARRTPGSPASLRTTAPRPSHRVRGGGGARRLRLAVRGADRAPDCRERARSGNHLLR